jgi:hypothetical protein
MAMVAIYVVEGVKDPKYQYDSRFLEEVKNPEELMTPCGKTGCEEAMKKT